MKTQKDSEKLNWDQKRSPSGTPIGGGAGAQSRNLPKPLVWLVLFVSATYVFYMLKLVTVSRASNSEPFSTVRLSSSSLQTIPKINATTSPLIRNLTSMVLRSETQTQDQTELQHLVFGIAASAKLWEHRKNYIELWYNSKKMRGVAWLDEQVKTDPKDTLLPVKISSGTSNFPYTHRTGHRSAIRISRVVSETLSLGMKDVRWFVMGDDDTVFVTENLLRILRKYDHNQFYYIGSSSESHLQNIFLSYGMGFGGAGFAVNYPLAKALQKMQDWCIHRYPKLFGSDDRMQACMTELGVPLTKQIGFHQYDVYGDLFGLLAAHPVTPLVSLHHLDVVEPIFPNMSRVEALQRLTIPMKLD